jgi:hypothetical protein
MTRANTKSIVFFINLLLLLVLCSACHESFYYPNMQNVPLFQKKGEIRGAAAISSGIAGADGRGYEFQGAYALSDHIGIMANYLAYTTLQENPFNIGEIGVGAFSTIKKYGSIDCFAGIGRAAVRDYGINYGMGYTGFGINYTKIFIQPSIGFTSPNFDIAFSNRIVFLTYDHIPVFTTVLLDKNATRYFQLIEPAITCRVGPELVKFQMQLVICPDDAIPHHNININAGLYISLKDGFNVKPSINRIIQSEISRFKTIHNKEFFFHPPLKCKHPRNIESKHTPT